MLLANRTLHDAGGSPGALMLAVYSANVVKNATHAQFSPVRPGQGAVGGTAWQAPSPALHKAPNRPMQMNSSNLISSKHP